MQNPLQKGDIENADKAVEILKEAAENESVMAQYQLGKIYLKDERLKNESLAIKYLTMAAEQNNSYAQYQLGKIYSDKTSSYYDIGKAIENFEKASDQDNSYAQYQLGKSMPERIQNTIMQKRQSTILNWLHRMKIKLHCTSLENSMLIRQKKCMTQRKQ